MLVFNFHSSSSYPENNNEHHHHIASVCLCIPEDVEDSIARDLSKDR